MSQTRATKIHPKQIARNIGRIADHPIGGPTLFSVANCLTFIRIFISPVFLLVYLQHDALGITRMYLPYVLLFLLGVSELSDALDGFLARKYNQVTDLGKILDPMADSISRISVFLTFTQAPVNVPLVLVFVFLYRDSVISTLRTICALRGFALAARPSGKIKAVIQGVAAFFITILLIPHSLGQLSDESLYAFSTIAVALSAAYALYSGIEYLVANRRHIQRILLRKNSNSRPLPEIAN
ncbi:MAG: CDP-diacylglycerol--glycerol-3-phosphate 3-phosphatidyltransferase [Chlamydiales bacterium]|nr:CDP-diacylglycerol--glycerol-3-phosphate 3-phosphatidyltransferase [Chlamydiales bacterium]